MKEDPHFFVHIFVVHFILITYFDSSTITFGFGFFSYYFCKQFSISHCYIWQRNEKIHLISVWQWVVAGYKITFKFKIANNNNKNVFQNHLNVSHLFWVNKTKKEIIPVIKQSVVKWVIIDLTKMIDSPGPLLMFCSNFSKFLKCMWCQNNKNI